MNQNNFKLKEPFIVWIEWMYEGIKIEFNEFQEVNFRQSTVCYSFWNKVQMKIYEK